MSAPPLLQGWQFIQVGQPDTVTDETDVDLSVRLIRADCFRVFTVERPAGVRSRDMDGWIRLLLEEKSPLPIEGLHWGYYELPRSAIIVVYCGWQRRIDNMAGSGLRKAVLALPDFFAPRPAAAISTAEVRRIQSWADTLELSYDEGGMLPSAVSRCESSSPAAATHSVALSLDGRTLRVEWAPTGSGASEVCSIRDWKVLRRADPRKNREMVAIEDAERSNRKFMQILAAAAVILVLLGGIQAGAIIWQGYLGRLAARVEAAQPHTESLQARFQLMERLQEMGAAAWSPFDMLSAVNGLRPVGIHFLSSQLVARDFVELRGEAATVETVNRFVNSLRESPAIQSVELRNLQSRGQVTFTMAIRFRWPLPPAGERADAVASAGSDDSGMI